MTWFQVLFAWPTGGVWSNFVDDVIVGLGITYLGRRAFQRLHAKADAHHAALLAQATAHHQAMLAHFGAVDPPPDDPTPPSLHLAA